MSEYNWVYQDCLHRLRLPHCIGHARVGLARTKYFAEIDLFFQSCPIRRSGFSTEAEAKTWAVKSLFEIIEDQQQKFEHTRNELLKIAGTK